jgi:peptidyl-prolyl cis-trans isomerase C
LRILKNIICNPLLHFFILGALIYVAYGSFGVQEYSDPERTIVVTPYTINWLEDTWEKRWNRPPTAEEKEGMIQEYVKESILYRQALEMGLDKDDVIVRRRLAQKLKFLTDDIIDIPEPSEEELGGYFKDNIDQYKSPDLTTFTHIFFDPDKREENTLTDAEDAKSKLQKLKNPTEGLDKFGDNFMLQSYYPEKSEQEISKLFGSQFAKTISEQSPGEWQGPILSGYGTHLLFVNGRIKTPEPAIEDVRDQVIVDWEDEKRKEINDQFYENLLSRYEVIIEEELPEEQEPQEEEKVE